MRCWSSTRTTSWPAFRYGTVSPLPALRSIAELAHEIYDGSRRIKAAFGLAEGLRPCGADTYDVYVTPRRTVRLVDFNPVGGTTAPLLFADWATLGYVFAAAAEPGSERVSAAAAGTDAAAAPGMFVNAPCCGFCRHSESCKMRRAHTVSPFRGAFVDSSTPHSSEASAPAAELAAASLHGHSITAGGTGGNSTGLHNGRSSSHANGSSQHHSSSVHSGANGSSSNGGPLQLPEVDFRIIDEPIVMRSAAQVRAGHPLLIL
jgi:D123